MLRGQLFELLTSSTGNNNIHVRSGRAIVDNTYYESDGTVDITTASPSTGTTGRLLVLQKTWGATQTIRLAIVTSADGTATIPATTQTSGTKWEIPLASFTITTGGVIGALTDLREYVLSPDAQRQVWMPVTDSTLSGASQGLLPRGTVIAAKLPDAATREAYVTFRVPDDFVTLTSAKLRSMASATGNIYRQIDTNYGGSGQVYNVGSGSVAASTYNYSVADTWQDAELSSILSGLAAGQTVGVQFQRVGANGSDTNTGDVYVSGLLLTYKII